MQRKEFLSVFVPLDLEIQSQLTINISGYDFLFVLFSKYSTYSIEFFEFDTHLPEMSILASMSFYSRLAQMGKHKTFYLVIITCSSTGGTFYAVKSFDANIAISGNFA